MNEDIAFVEILTDSGFLEFLFLYHFRFILCYHNYSSLFGRIDNLCYPRHALNFCSFSTFSFNIFFIFYIQYNSAYPRSKTTCTLRFAPSGRRNSIRRYQIHDRYVLRLYDLHRDFRYHIFDIFSFVLYYPTPSLRFWLCRNPLNYFLRKDTNLIVKLPLIFRPTKKIEYFIMSSISI